MFENLDQEYLNIDEVAYVFHEIVKSSLNVVVNEVEEKRYSEILLGNYSNSRKLQIMKRIINRISLYNETNEDEILQMVEEHILHTMMSLEESV